MKIAYNGLFLTRPHTGMGQYTQHLLTELAKALPKAEHVAIVPGRADAPKGVTVEVVKPARYGVGEGLALDRWESHDVPKRARALGADLLLTPYPTPPADADIPVVMTVHDMIPWQLPAYRRSLRSRLKLRRIFEGIRQADHLLTVSKFSRDSIVNLAAVDPKRITIVYDGVDERYRQRPAPAAITTVRKRLKLADRPYVLYLGGYDYRKNVRRLIEAFAASGLAETHDLALAGAVTAPPGALYDDYRQLPELLRAAGVSGQTKRLGFIDEADKPALLAGADAFVFPSVAEGFGIPILEALGLGVPVAAGKIPSTRELFPGAVNLFDPADPADMAAALKRAVGSKSKTRVAKGKALAKKFTWPAAAKRTAAALKDLN